MVIEFVTVHREIKCLSYICGLSHHSVVYVNSFLATLNARNYLREMSSEDAGHISTFGFGVSPLRSRRAVSAQSPTVDLESETGKCQP